ncbi:MAG: hypothetical protein K0M45_09780 [Candidatus Paracaedibacteraceae bacterium]|nr:hypothetical protein [Candidatus Paracaedibacteraceae bacterium]
MNIRCWSLSLSLCVSSLSASDYLTLEQQHETINKGLRSQSFFAKLTSSPETNVPSSSSLPIFPSSEFPVSTPTSPKFQALSQTLRKNLSLDADTQLVSRETFLDIQAHAAQTMFHQLNSTLTFLLTSKTLIRSTLLKQSELSQLIFTSLKLGTADKEKFFPSSDLLLYHPVAELAQQFNILREFQYWIDIVTVFKKTIFPTYSLSSYQHNKAVAIKKLIQDQLKFLGNKINALQENPFSLSSQLDDGGSVCLNTRENFYYLLQECFNDLNKALPNVTNTFVTPKVKNLPKSFNRGREGMNLVLEKLYSPINKLNAYFYENYPALFSVIHGKAIAELAQANSLDILPNRGKKEKSPLSSFDSNLKYKYSQLFGGLTNNYKMVEAIRKELGLSGRIFDGINLEKEFNTALELYNQLKAQTQRRFSPFDKGSTVNLAHETSVDPLLEREEKIEPAREEPLQEENLQKVKLPIEELPQTAEPMDREQLEEEEFMFDTEYFKKVHAYHQTKKKQKITTDNTSVQEVSSYEKELCTYLKENIYRPSHRSTWTNLISHLSQLGFQGKPNTVGNGSTWRFSVNHKNKLFFEDNDYRQATFNVHEYKGNGPIHPTYLKFFISGFSNIFGLTETYIDKVINAGPSLPSI